MHLIIHLSQQILVCYEGTKALQTYAISTGINGYGEEKNSGKTPRGLHIVRAKIGENLPINSVLRGRRPTGEIYNASLAAQYPNRDWILSRILWLSGCEIGKNRLGNVDTMQRYIYLHGTPDSEPMGVPASHGCIRLHNADMISLFNRVPLACKVDILED